MGRPKGSKNKAADKKKDKDPNVEDTYETTVEFMCPKRGLVKQKVRVKKMKPVNQDAVRQIMTDDDGLSDLEKEQEITPFDEDTE